MFSAIKDRAGLPQIRQWLKRHPQPPDKPVSVQIFSAMQTKQMKLDYYLGGSGALAANGKIPERGLLIISKVWVAGPYDRKGMFAPLRPAEPIAQIGHSMLARR